MLEEADLEDEIPGRKWFALYPKDGPRRPAASIFLQFLAGAEAREAIAESLAIPVGWRALMNRPLVEGAQ